MTTIACDGKSLAADGMATCNGIVTDRNMIKIWKLKDGRLLGCAGDAGTAIAFREWLEGGEKPELNDNFDALVLNRDGECFYYSRPNLVPVPAELPTAIGSGMGFAIAAMDAGATAVRAVEIACGRDTLSGGHITVLHLEPAP